MHKLSAGQRERRTGDRGVELKRGELVNRAVVVVANVKIPVRVVRHARAVKAGVGQHQLVRSAAERHVIDGVRRLGEARAVDEQASGVAENALEIIIRADV